MILFGAYRFTGQSHPAQMTFSLFDSDTDTEFRRLFIERLTLPLYEIVFGIFLNLLL